MLRRLLSWRGRAGAMIFATGAMLCVTGASAGELEWQPDFRFPGTFFPSFALASAGKDAQGPTSRGQSYGFLGSGSMWVKVAAAPVGAKLRAEVEIPEIGVAGDIEAPPSDGTPKYLVPRLRWSQTRLTAIRQPISADAVFRLYQDGKLLGEEHRPVRVRAINDAVLKACRSPEQCVDFSPYLAAFVNEDHPIIDRILRDALNIPAMPVRRWIGTQGDEAAVIQQVWAIWYLLQRSGMTYSSITTVADSAQQLQSQTVRPLTQALSTEQANCIDGTALFASILRKIGIEPMLVLVPGHAFLGFYVDARHTKPAFLETTMLNSQANPFANGHRPSQLGQGLSRLTGVDVNMQRSMESFNQALATGARNYQAAAPNFGKPGFTLLPISKARASGILPIPL